ncbi:MAG: hypothetical protein AB7D37_04680 [Desulfovibrio sp.]
MSVYECPYCEAELSPEDLALLTTKKLIDYSQDDFTFESETTCPRCRRPLLIVGTIYGETELKPARTVMVDGEEVPDMEYDMADVMRHFAKRPDQLRVAPDEVTCEVCRRSGDTDCRTAADYIKAGWRVVAEYPGVRATCPACRGGVHAHAA